MLIRRLIHAFEDIVDLHVEPDDVRKWIIENGLCDEIVFHYVDTDPALFNGIFIERHVDFIQATGVYREPKHCREIFVCDRQEEDMRRFTEVKEMLHILDRAEEQTTTLVGINGLINYAATHLAPVRGRGSV